jgi:signal transduction histidine kinase
LKRRGNDTLVSPAWLQSGFGAALSAAFTDLDVAEPGAPCTPVSRFAISPILLLANVVIALGFVDQVQGIVPVTTVLAWSAAAVFASLLPMPLYWWRKRYPRLPESVDIRLYETCAVALGLVWASFPIFFFDSASLEVRLLAVALIFAISGLGSLALARVPTAAILFCALITGSLTLTSIKTGGSVGLVLGLCSLLYNIGVSAMILQAHGIARQAALASAEVRKQNDIISLLLNDFGRGAGNWLWETDAAGRLTYVSAGLGRAIGKRPDAILGRSLRDTIPTNANDPAWPAIADAMDAREPVNGIIFGLNGLGDTRSWWRMTAQPRFSEDNVFEGYRGAAQDVTDGREAEAQLIAAKEVAERASASKTQFLAVMSHELRTPLNAIVGFADLLASPQAENLSPEARIDHLKTIVESSHHLQSLINDILDATRIEKGTLRLAEQEADAAELVEVAVKMCRDAADRADATIIARVVDGVELRGDITRIKQVLINLVTNAVKFSPPGGFVNIGFEKTAQGGLAISVRDGGVGMRKEDLDRVFEPFVQADTGSSRRFGGIGLGLSIARKIAHLHGGNVTLESEFGVGTTARLILPASRVQWQAAKPAPLAATAS